MITTIGNFKVFKTSLTDSTLTEKVRSAVTNNFETSFAEPLEGLTAEAIFEKYLPAIEEFKQATGITGDVKLDTVWYRDFQRGWGMEDHVHPFARAHEENGFSLIHYVVLPEEVSPVHFLEGEERKLVEGTVENDVVIFDAELGHGVNGDGKGKPARMFLCANFLIG